MKEQVSIGRKAAIKMFEDKWWIGKTPLEIASVQFFTLELCTPFDVFQEALTSALGHPVFTHELALNWNVIAEELLACIEKTTAPTSVHGATR